MPPQKLTPEIINAAIGGFEQQKIRINVQIAELRALLTGTPTEPAATPEAPKSKRRMSAAARKRISEAQRKRWAESKGHSESPSEKGTPKPKRKMSAAGRAAIVAATKKRWEAFYAAKQAKKPALKKAIAKKKLSPARKVALLANLAKARAARAAKATAGAQ